VCAQEGIYDRFVAAVVTQCERMRTGPALGGSFVDCGALCMPHHARHVQALVDDAVAKGAKVRSRRRESLTGREEGEG
jgi:acyl-CoA reductase-like NAD-dependent aldehyde dehydrogenase